MQSDLGDVTAACLQHGAGFPDLDGVEIRHQRNAQILSEIAAQMILGNKKSLGNLINIRNMVVIFVDIFEWHYLPNNKLLRKIVSILRKLV